jgi:mRNA-degrading endonuclease toxin of MazEF toxin-antitoxin module
MADPDPVIGDEQGDRRPVLVVSIHTMNRAAARLVISVPLTTTDRESKLHVRVEPPEGGLERASYALPEMVRRCPWTALGAGWAASHRTRSRSWRIDSAFSSALAARADAAFAQRPRKDTREAASIPARLL